MDNDLISREDLKKELNSRVFQDDYATTLLLSSFNDIIDNAPSVDISKLILIVATRSGKREMMLNVLRPQGKWNYIQAGMCVCPFCGATPHNQYKNFCPKCGAKMEGGAEE